MSGLDSDDETDSDGTIDDKYNLCKEKGPSRRSLAIQSGCKVNGHYLLSWLFCGVSILVTYLYKITKIGIILPKDDQVEGILKCRNADRLAYVLTAKLCL